MAAGGDWHARGVDKLEKRGFEAPFFMEKRKNRVIISWKIRTVRRSLNTFLANPSYRVARAFVLSNARDIRQEGAVTYLPVYFACHHKISFFAKSSEVLSPLQYTFRRMLTSLIG